MADISQHKRCKLDDATGRDRDQNENVESTILEEESLANEDDEEEKISSLIVDLVISSSTDVSFLKTCRLVNKYWNSLACTALQTVSITKLIENDLERWNNFCELQVARSFGPLALLPVPFKNFHVDTVGFEINQFYELVLCPNIVTVSLKISDAGNLERLEEFLQAKKNDLTELTVLGLLHHEDMMQVFRSVMLPALTELFICTICAFNDNCGHVELLKTVLTNSPLKKLNIKAVLPSCLLSMLTMNLSQIVDFSFNFNNNFPPPKEFWNALAIVQFPRLKFLTMLSFGDENAIPPTNQLNSFFSNHASQLVRLNHNFIYELPLTLVFPKLKTLRVPVVTDCGIFFTQERFPSLRDIFQSIATIQSLYFMADEDNAHRGIRKFGISLKDYEQAQLDEVFPNWMITLGRKFPNIIEFHIRLDTWYSLYFVLTHMAFPKLKEFSLSAQVSFLTLSGTYKEEVEKYLDSGQLIENIPRGNSILDFKELVTLEMDFRVLLSNDMVQYCLALMTSLQSLRIYWNSELSTQVLGESLQHLKFLHILNPESCGINVIEDLKAALPNCKVD